MRGYFSKFGFSLRFQVCASVLGTLLIIVGCISVYYIRMGRETLYGQIRDDANKLKGALYSSLDRLMLEESPQSMHRTMEALSNVEGIRNVVITDSHGRIAFSTDLDSVGKNLAPLNDPTCLLCHQNQQKPELWPKDIIIKEDNEKWLRTVQPIPNREACHKCHPPKERLRGKLIVDYSLKRADANIALNQRNLIAMVITLLIVGSGLIIIVLERLVLRPLARLRRDMQAFADGDLTARVKEGGRNEIGQLGTSFNKMAERLKAATEELAQLAATDVLTRLYNRRYFDEFLIKVQQQANRYREFFSIIIIDIDRFKKFNDLYGHPLGDKVLTLVADEIKQSTQNSDICARYGGDEFVVILPRTSKDGARLYAERTRARVAAYRYFPETEKFEIATEGEKRGEQITLSVGIASYPDDGDKAAAVLRQADEALYEAKRMGRNRVVLAGSSSKDTPLL